MNIKTPGSFHKLQALADKLAAIDSFHAVHQDDVGEDDDEYSQDVSEQQLAGEIFQDKLDMYRREY